MTRSAAEYFLHMRQLPFFAPHQMRVPHENNFNADQYPKFAGARGPSSPRAASAAGTA